MGTAPTLKLTEMAGFVAVSAEALLNAGHLNVLDGPCRLFTAFAKTDSAQIDFLKLWDNTSPTVGTTAPDYAFKVESDVWHPIPLDPDGVVFDNGLSIAADDAGGTALGANAAAFDVFLVLRRGAS